MTKEQALEKKLEQTKWQFPNHVVFKHKGKVYHFDPSNFNEENIFVQTGLKVYKEDDNAALYDPEYFEVDKFGVLGYKGTATEKISQPINLKNYDCLFYGCRCQTIDLSDWDFSEVTSVNSMFRRSEFISLNLGNANFSKCEDFGGCFLYCNRLKELVLGSYKVLQDVCTANMFHGCDKLFEKYDKPEEELADVFKNGQWNRLQPVERMEAFK